jgi:molybdate transport system substrate-binding protein
MRLGKALLGLGAAVAASLMLTSCGGGDSAAGKELIVLCGGGIRPAMQDLKVTFEKETGCLVKVNYGGSGVLFGQLQSGVKADLYVPGDTAYIKRGQKKGLVGAYKVAAWFVPVIAVAKGNPKGVKGIADLTRSDLKVGLGKAGVNAVGDVTRDVLRANGLAGKVELEYEGITTVNELANQIKLKTVDVVVIWDATAAQYADDFDVIPIKDANTHAVPFGLGLIKDAPNKKLAEQFSAFAASEAGGKIFKRHQYTVPGRTLRIACGSSMRPPIESLAALFKKEFGVEAKPNYGGSGTVLLHIQESKEGDIYVCHDPYAYICENRKLSAGWHTIAHLQPTIAVQKGNPKKVEGLMDLLRDDVKIGLPHRETSTRGRILWAILKEQKLDQKMLKRKFTEDRTHALVNKLKLGAVDIAVLWDAPTRAMDDVEEIPIESKYRVDAVTSATSGKTYPVDKVKVTVVRIALSKEPLLTAQFAKMCLSEAGRKIMKRHRFELPPKP